MHMPQIGVGNIRQRLNELLSGGKRQINAFLEMLDVPVDNVKTMTDDDYEALIDGVAGLHETGTTTSRRILNSRMDRMTGMSFPDIWMPVPLVRRIAGLGLNPIGIAACGVLELQGATILEDGAAQGWVVECETERRHGDRYEISPSIVGDQIVWDGLDNDLTLLGKSYPETLVMRYEGGPLEDLVTCPLTDGMDLHIWEVATREDIEATTIRLREPRFVQLRDVADLLQAPQPDWRAVGRTFH